MVDDARDTYMNVRDTARALGVHENTIRNWVKAGVLLSARVPGSRNLRFAKSEVERLQRERGQSASLVGASLQTVGPELVTASDLARWADSLDAKGAFPDLMRRLLAVTPGITSLEVRAYEGVAGHGWDGRATSSGSAFLPEGELRFEFGTDRDPKNKANRDYAKRIPDASIVYVAATPRNWPSGSTWADEKALEKKFANVKAIDGHVLEGWLSQAPSVHVWISEKLGFNPRGAKTIERWFLDFSLRTSPVLPAGLFKAGRKNQVDKLRDAVTAAYDGLSVTVQGQWRDEVIAFIYAAFLGETDLLERTVVVEDPKAWMRIIDSKNPLILVPTFSGASEIAQALDRGHHVVVPAEHADAVSDRKLIRLPKVDRSEADSALSSAFAESSSRQSMVALARRSMAALFRTLSRDSRMRKPGWAVQPDIVSLLAPLMLAGQWTGHEGDLAAIEALTEHSPEEINRRLQSLLVQEDAPFIQSAGNWRLVSAREAARLLLPALTPTDLERWRRFTSDVLLATDPFDGMGTVQRLTAGTRGIRANFSEILTKGAADGLAIAAVVNDESFDSPEVRHAIHSIVAALFSTALTDASGKTWRALSASLPRIAEASPNQFMEAVASDLAGDEPVLRTLFRDNAEDPFAFGSSSPHTSLLWALELLCWSPAHFGGATELLSRLAALDPGGRLSNRPIASLQNVSLGWIRQSGATGAGKIAMIRRVLKREPSVGWQLVLGVWPSSHAVAFPPHKPVFREWNAEETEVTLREWGEYVDALAQLATDAAATDPKRWVEIVPVIDELPPTARSQIISRLRGIVERNTWSEDERYALWEAVRTEVDHHEEFPDADWAMAEEDVASFRAIASLLEPREDPRRLVDLFEWRPMLAGHKRIEAGYDDELANLRRTAVEAVRRQGPKALASLIESVKQPGLVGRLLAGDPEALIRAILNWLTTDDGNLRQAALTFATARMEAEGWTWLTETALPALETDSARAALMGSVPFSSEFWSKISSLGHELESEYWTRVDSFGVRDSELKEAAEVLLSHGRGWKALELLSLMHHRELEPDVDQVKRALKSILAGTDQRSVQTMDSYYVQQQLEFLELKVPSDEDLPSLEFAFHPILHDGRPSGALFRALGNQPAEFVRLVEAVYRPEGEPPADTTANEQALAHIAFRVLREWRSLPGTREDGSVDGDQLMSWVRAARLAFADSGRAAVGDEQIGEVLACSPLGKDGAWPVEEVRDVIDMVGSPRLDNGVHIGRVNRRGITSRGVFDGGDQERALEAQYRGWAEALSIQWPRTARILSGIADGYRDDARLHDMQAERMGDEG